MGVDPLGGEGVHYWAAIAEHDRLDLSVISDEVDPTFGFMTLDWDGQIRMDPSSSYAMQILIAAKDRFDIAFACDTDHDRHGIVTSEDGLLPPNHCLSVAIDCLLRHRPRWGVKAATFGNAYRGSTLETVVGSLAEQRQIFKGADHAFLWKPKLRIPDIYEIAVKQKAFARLLDACDRCDTVEAIIDAIQRIDALQIKGLGPAVANLLCFIHATLVSLFNMAIVGGYNAVTGANVKLGR